MEKVLERILMLLAETKTEQKQFASAIGINPTRCAKREIPIYGGLNCKLLIYRDFLYFKIQVFYFKIQSFLNEIQAFRKQISHKISHENHVLSISL